MVRHLYLFIPTLFFMLSCASESHNQPAIAATEAALAPAVWQSIAAPRSVYGQYGTVTRISVDRLLFVRGAQAWLYDGATRAFTEASPMNAPRSQHTGTLLRDGRVLIVGGTEAASSGSAEIFEPATGTWSPAAAMHSPRWGHDAALLADGRVMIAGGLGPTVTCVQQVIHIGAIDVVNPIGNLTTEIYDPATDTWTLAALAPEMHEGGLLKALPNGKVLLAAGQRDDGTCDGPDAPHIARRDVLTASLYDPDTGSWAPAQSPANGYVAYASTATQLANGDVLIVGSGSTGPLHSEVYRANDDRWEDTAYPDTPVTGRNAATLLTDGRVLITGGGKGSTRAGDFTALYDPTQNRWTFAAPPAENHQGGSVGALSAGRALLAFGDYAPMYAELFDPRANAAQRPCSDSSVCPGQICVDGFCCDASCADEECSACSFAAGSIADGVCTALHEGLACSEGVCQGGVCHPTPGWGATGPMPNPSANARAASLSDGRVLVVGGSTLEPKKLAQLYDPTRNAWTVTGPMIASHYNPALVRLSDGRLVVVDNAPELYDPATGGWSALPGPLVALDFPAAVTLPDGRVFTLGGSPSIANNAQLFDPAKVSWSMTAQSTVARDEPSLALLRDGRVLVMGPKEDPSLPLAPELYDPAANAWSAVAVPRGAAFLDPLLVLQDGTVLWVRSDQTERYDSTTNTWSSEPVMPTDPAMQRPYDKFGVAVLTTGNVLVAGGYSFYQDESIRNTAYEFDPVLHQWSQLPTMIKPRVELTLVALPAGGALAIGGFGPSQTELETQVSAETHPAHSSPRTRGHACASAAECRSGYCVDGVCCDGACVAAGNVCSAVRGAIANGYCALSSASLDDAGLRGDGGHDGPGVDAQAPADAATYEPSSAHDASVSTEDAGRSRRHPGHCALVPRNAARHCNGAASLLTMTGLAAWIAARRRRRTIVSSAIVSDRTTNSQNA